MKKCRHEPTWKELVLSKDGIYLCKKCKKKIKLVKKKRYKWIEICCPIIYIVGINALFDILESINMLDMALLSCVLLVIGLTAYFIYLQKLRIYVLEDESV